MNRFSQLQRAGQSYRPGGRRQEFATKLAFGANLAENTKLTETPLCPLWLFLNSLIRSIRAIYAIGIRGYLRFFVPIRHYICRESSTNQLLFMQNKPNFLKSQMILSCLYTKDYQNFIPLAGKKTNPILSGLRCLRRSCRTDQTQTNPISEKPK
jgi:hypothetical protein